MSSGGLFGKGIGASQQKWGNLPEAHTDFIFAVLGEELGLVGTAAGARPLPDHRLRRRSGSPRRTKDPFVRYMAAGITIWLIGADDASTSAWCWRCSRSSAPAAAGVLRRLRAAALAGRARPAGLASPAPSPRRRPRLRDRAPPALSAGRHRRRRPSRRHAMMDPAGRRRHGGAHLARCSPPPTPCAGSTPRSRSPRLGTPRGLEGRVVPEAGYPLELIPPVPLPAPARRRPAPRARPAARRRQGRAGGRRPGPRPTSSSASAATSRCPPTSRPGAGTCRSSCTRATPCPASPTRLGARFTDARRDQLPRHRRCRTPTYIGLPIRRMISTLDRAALRAEARRALRARPGPADAAGHRRLPGRAPAQPGRRRGRAPPSPPPASRCCTSSARRARPRSPASAGAAAVRRAAVRRPDGPRLRRRRPRGLPGRRQHRHRGRRGRSARGVRAAADRQRRAGAQRPPGGRRRRRAARRRRRAHPRVGARHRAGPGHRRRPAGRDVRGRGLR